MAAQPPPLSLPDVRHGGQRGPAMPLLRRVLSVGSSGERRQPEPHGVASVLLGFTCKHPCPTAGLAPLLHPASRSMPGASGAVQASGH